ncbi:MAG TPA: hypothetical protein ENH41_01305 [Candidatus Omnitrophica bacterium]|nr:hypothetical protein [Candidatus Omnitrophota bacterium]
MKKEQKQLGEVLIAKGLITQEQLNGALAEQKRTDEFLGALLLKRRAIKEKDLLIVLSEQFGIPYVSMKDKYIDWKFVGKFDPSLILDFKCFPAHRDNYSVTMAVINPLDVWMLKKAEMAAGGLKLNLVLVSCSDMNELVRRYSEYSRAKYI